MNNNQRIQAVQVYQCYICHIDPNFAAVDYPLGPRLIQHMRNSHGFAVVSRSQHFRRNQFIGGFNFINAMPDDGNAVRRLCCPCCGFNTDIGKHQELYLHYYSRNHVIARGNAPDPALLQEPARELPFPAQPALPAVVARGLPTVQPAQQHQPVQLAPDVPAAVAWEDLSDQQLREATGRRGWDWQNIDLHGNTRVWLNYARHGDPNFVRRRDNWNYLRIEEYIANSHPDEDEPENIPDDIE